MDKAAMNVLEHDFWWTCEPSSPGRPRALIWNPHRTCPCYYVYAVSVLTGLLHCRLKHPASTWCCRLDVLPTSWPYHAWSGVHPILSQPQSAFPRAPGSVNTITAPTVPPEVSPQSSLHLNPCSSWGHISLWIPSSNSPFKPIFSSPSPLPPPGLTTSSLS